MRCGKRPTKIERAAWRRRQHARYQRRQLELDRDDELCPWRSLERAAAAELQARRRGIVQRRRRQLGRLAHQRGGR